MKTSVKDIIRRRKSARTFRGESLRSENRQKPNGFLKTADNPFDIPIKFRSLDAKKYSHTVMPAADNRPEYIVTCEVNR